MEAEPIQVIQPRLWNFGRLAPRATAMKVMNDHHTVQAAWSERAFKPVATPRILVPTARIQLQRTFSSVESLHNANIPE